MCLRTPKERALQIFCLESGGFLFISPLYAWLFQVTLRETLALILTLSVIEVIWSIVYNTAFDWLHFRASGRVASERCTLLRFVQALGQEVSAMLLTVPVLIWMGGFDLREAVLVDLGLTAVYVGYLYVFHLTYDRLRPVKAQVETA